MKLSDIIKKGSGAPAPSDLIVGGIGIDVTSGLIYSKKSDDTIFSVGNGIKEIVASGGTTLGEDTILTFKYFDSSIADVTVTLKAGKTGDNGTSSNTFTLSGTTLNITG